MHKGQTKDIRTTIKQFSKKMKNLPEIVEVEHSENINNYELKEKKRLKLKILKLKILLF